MGFWAAGDSVTTIVCLTDATGAASDADSLPTGQAYLNGASNGAAVTVTHLTTGRYAVTWTNPGANGDAVAVVLSFMMGGITSHATIWEARLAATPPTAAAIRAEMDSNSTQLAAIAADASAASDAATDNQTTLAGLKTAALTATEWSILAASEGGGDKELSADGGTAKLYRRSGAQVDTETP